MAGKFYLEDPKKKPEDPEAPKFTPSAIHLVRRADYLCGLIKEYEENLRIYQEQQAAAHAPPPPIRSFYQPPIPGSSRAGQSPAVSVASDEQGGKKRRKTPVFTDSEDESDYASMDEDAVKEELRPVKAQLRRLKGGTGELPREEKLTVLKDCLSVVGQRIEQVVASRKARGENEEKWRKHCWVFASFFWPRAGVNYAKLQSIHAKMMNVSVFPSFHRCGSKDLTRLLLHWLQQNDLKPVTASPAIATASPGLATSAKKKRAQPTESTSSPVPASSVKKIKLIHKTDGGVALAEPKKGKKKKEEKSAAIIKDEDEPME